MKTNLSEPTKIKTKGSEMSKLNKINKSISTIERIKKSARAVYIMSTILIPAGFAGYLLLGYRSDFVIITLAIALALIALYNLISLSWKVESNSKK